MGFEFPLAPVLWLRGVVEEREERVLKQILREIATAVERISALASEIAEVDARRRSALAKPCNAVHLHAWYSQVEELKRKRKDSEQRLEKLEELRDKQLAVYHAARRDRKMLDEMREQGRAAYDSDVARRQQSQLDDRFGSQRPRK